MKFQYDYVKIATLLDGKPYVRTFSNLNVTVNVNDHVE